MPKLDKNSAAGARKALATKMRSKGLGKLRWYCQMCQKQCRDQNGFKCHLTSEAHQRQLLLFAENPEHYLDDFSADLKKGYLETLRRTFGTKRMKANIVYTHYIKDKHHIHMNATKWHTLTGFIHHLADENLVRIDQTEQGWYIQYIDRAEEEAKERREKKVQQDLDDEERMTKLMDEQARRALEQERNSGKDIDKPKAYAEFRREEALIKINMNAKKNADNIQQPSTSNIDDKERRKEIEKPKMTDYELGKLAQKLVSQKRFSEDAPSAQSNEGSVIPSKKPRNVLEEIQFEEEQRREKENRKDYWLHKGIIVKIITKKLGADYYKMKGEVIEVKDRYTGLVRIAKAEQEEVLKLDQSHVETVIPAIDKRVLVVNGAYRNCRARLLKIDEKMFAVTIKIESGPFTGQKVENVAYEDVSKLSQQ